MRNVSVLIFYVFDAITSRMIKMKYLLLGIIFILGYTNLSYELIILRQLINFLGSNILITSIVMAFILLFLSVGYYIGSVISFSKYSIRKLNTKLLFGLSAWYIISGNFDIMSFFFVGLENLENPILKTFLFSGIWLVFPALATGFVTASIGRIIHNINQNYTGRFMAIDTMGSVLGSLLTTLIFMPLIGVSVTVFILAALVALTLLFNMGKKDRVCIVFLFLWLLLLSSIVNVYLPFQNSPYLIKDDAISRVEIIPDKKENSKLMRINGSSSSKIAQDHELMFPYIQFINSFIKSLPNDKKYKILVLGAGGFTAGINDEQNEYTFLDIEPKLKEISEKHFLEKPLGKNKKFIAQDAYFYMLQNKQKYDIIFLDVYSSRMNIPINFVTRDFLKLTKSALSPNGYLLANIITSPTFENTFSKRVDNTFRFVFPQYLSRQIIHDFELNSDELNNIIYIYHHLPEDSTIYTLDKNSAMYGQF